MNKIFRFLFSPSLSENLKSKIQNRKLVRLFVIVITFAICEAVAQAQQAGKIYRVGRLSGALSSSRFGQDALRRELQDLGYIEGKNLSFELRYAEEKPERLSALADELVRWRGRIK